MHLIPRRDLSHGRQDRAIQHRWTFFCGIMCSCLFAQISPRRLMPWKRRFGAFIRSAAKSCRKFDLLARIHSMKQKKKQFKLIKGQWTIGGSEAIKFLSKQCDKMNFQFSQKKFKNFFSHANVKIYNKTINTNNNQVKNTLIRINPFIHIHTHTSVCLVHPQQLPLQIYMYVCINHMQRNIIFERFFHTKCHHNPH